MSYSKFIAELRTRRLRPFAIAAIREARGYSTDDLAGIVGHDGRRHALLAEAAHVFADEAATAAEDKAAADDRADAELADFLARGQAIDAATDAVRAAAAAAGWTLAWRHGSRSSGSVYYWLCEPDSDEAEGERYSLRVSDHHAPIGGGWNEERQERHDAPDINIVIRRGADGGYTFALDPLMELLPS